MVLPEVEPTDLCAYLADGGLRVVARDRVANSGILRAVVMGPPTRVKRHEVRVYRRLVFLHPSHEDVEGSCRRGSRGVEHVP